MENEFEYFMSRENVRKCTLNHNRCQSIPLMKNI